MPDAFKVSPLLESLFTKGLLDRLPLSFSAFCLDQIKEWDLLFPAERNYFERLFRLLDRTSQAAVEELFSTLRAIERRMGVNERTFPKGQFTLEQVDFLNRNPHYSEWRATIAQVFAALDPALDAEIARSGHERLVIVVSPPQLPVDPSQMWLRLQHRGKRIPLELPEQAEDFLPLLLTGRESRHSAPTVAELFSAGKHGGPYTSWIIEANAILSTLGTGAGTVVHYSYENLAGYRKRLMREVQKMVETREIPGPRQLSARLKQLKLMASEGDAAKDPILAEFVRAILLSGNGTLLINNTFVEWATIQAVRRARPSVAILGFGIRNKVKPFSSLLIYADQDATNPIPSQMDSLGSYIDLEIFYQYIWQEFEKYAEYRANTAYLFAGQGMEEMMVIAPPDFPLLSAPTPVRVPTAFQHLKDWLSL
jgi:hypothetical protein